MTPADVQGIINCINQLNKAVDFKQWEKLPEFLTKDLEVSFPKSSIVPNSRISIGGFQNHLINQLSDVKSLHRDYNFFIKTNDGIACKADFKIEVYSESQTLIWSASGVHFYKMINEAGKWKIAGIQRKIIRVDAPLPQQNEVQYVYR
ncbi:MAG: hypothetical protein NWR83_08900 [Salibacteraceae bacterium]|jgi:hypothetical protein|nr:hypothetical protein [Salibacteraceae bacterium]MDP4844568.1 hypothetical protein [Salibacteraceae bacterium]